jgi:hypothetical protein
MFSFVCKNILQYVEFVSVKQIFSSLSLNISFNPCIQILTQILTLPVLKKLTNFFSRPNAHITDFVKTLINTSCSRVLGTPAWEGYKGEK